ncbi:endochitinase-like [Corylus avellana]|uniref:endochitinase-like n=1 Tax=Corylus avellana TaxID=13451 RepID=UPI001E222D92|nr:endochitinase-like [Corylus avellana]
MKLILFLAFLLGTTSAEQCGHQAGGALCPNGLCCSEYGWCGTTIAYCGTGCQSQCAATPPPPPPNPTPSPPPPPNPTPSPPPGDGVASIISATLFDQLLKYRNDPRCRSNGFYTYNAFIAAANSFAGFGTTGDADTRKREIAAFLGQTSHETTGGWADAPDGPYAWGYCFVEEINKADYCTPSNEWPCAPGKQYFGRGPIQLTHNYNYGQAGQGLGLGLNLLNNPDLVAQDEILSFKTAIWFWMTPQANKPSSHDVIIGKWTPTATDTAAGRVPGYGVITNIINGGLECGRGPDSRVESRIGFYIRYCDEFGVSYGDNLDCNNQRPFA